MSGDLFLEIEEENAQSIVEAYQESIQDISDVPEQFKFNWIESYIADKADYLSEMRAESLHEEERLKEE